MSLALLDVKISQMLLILYQFEKKYDTECFNKESLQSTDMFLRDIDWDLSFP